jgi:IS1 family transposase/lambda repressor-like predicted transcriptional regulator
MNKLPLAKRVAILRALTEGCSLRSTSRMAGASINTVTKLLIDAGKACARYQHEVMRKLDCRRLQLDEIWGFVYAKDKNVPAEMEGQFGVGSVWTWVAIDADTKLIPSWLVGLRDGDHARAFVDDLAGRLANRVQITTDGLKAYLLAVDMSFGGLVDYAVLHKIYGAENPQEARYSPAQCIGCERHAVHGKPDPDHISTSFVERQNLTLRMRNRRFTRLTNAFSKKLENLEHSVALHFFVYNFITRHQTLRMPPALKAKVTDHVWSFEELVKLIDRYSARQPN